jgi:hypothetical protein
MVIVFRSSGVVLMIVCQTKKIKEKGEKYRYHNISAACILLSR